MAEVTMPRLSDTMSEGTVGRWLKQPGDQVEKGEIIAEIETDKATMELESFDNGTLQKIIISEGQTVPIGEVIAIIGEGAVEPAAEPSAQPAPIAPAPAAEAPQAPAPAADPSPTAAPAASAGIKASPVARRIAAELGVDLGNVQGTGPGGRIIKENVEAYARSNGGKAATPAQPPAAAPSAPAVPPAPAPAAPAPAAPVAPVPVAPAPGEVQPMGRMRRAIARAMAASKPGVPHIYVTAEIDMQAAYELRRQINESQDVRISLNDMLIKAAARALITFPALNSRYAETPDGQPAVYTYPGIHISVAVAIDEGLVAPVVFDADKKSLGTINSEVRDLAARARENKLKQNELEGGSFQISNMGMFDVVEFVSIINASQSASLSVGALREIPVVRDGAIVPGRVMNVTISVDHRVVDGAIAARYLQELNRLLQSPMSLLV